MLVSKPNYSDLFSIIRVCVAHIPDLNSHVGREWAEVTQTCQIHIGCHGFQSKSESVQYEIIFQGSIGYPIYDV